MTITEQIITIAMCTLGTMATRFLPFLLFRSDKPTPKYIQYLGKMPPGRWCICCLCSLFSEYCRKIRFILITV